jgi:hypothetical protein
MDDPIIRHGQKALQDAVAAVIDRCCAEWDLTPVEIVGVLNMLATAVTIRVLDGTFGEPEEGGDG